MKELLLEIGVEELPAIPFLRELPNINAKWQAVLEKYNITSEFKFYYTPRRLVFFHEKFPQAQPDSVASFVGAPKQVALKDGAFTKAALSFANKCGISESELKFKEIDGKEVLYYEKEVKGEPVAKIMGDMVEEFLKSLSFGKSMRWGNGEFEFIRPIRSFLCLLGDEVIKFNKFGVESGNSTYPHRSISYDKIKISNIKEYFEGLKSRGVVLEANEREKIILDEFEKISQKSGLKIEIDKDLLAEVVAITEYPTALLGSFEEEFLEVPSEVIITSMKENQRYFPVFKDDKLANGFVVVSNAITQDYSLIIKGNEKVLRARLSDAMFFWQSDLKAEFSPEKLKNITYLKELGSIYEKELRELKVAKKLASNYDELLKKEAGEYGAKLERAVMLSKADLTTQMVYEFTELQGIMGAYYAKAKNEDENVVLAIKEQYLPDGEEAQCPSKVFSSVVALSNKLDTLMGLFSIGKIPSGTKDPYALRRAANGVIKIVLAHNLKFNVKEILEDIAKDYKKFDVEVLINFILDRLYTFFDANASIVKACIKSGEKDILELTKMIEALAKISSEPNFRENFSTFKRLANIIKDDKFSKVDESLFEIDAEKALNDAFKAVDKSLAYEPRLKALFALKPQIDEFFDKVMINVENEKVRNNRVAIIGQIYSEILKVADIKEISF